MIKPISISRRNLLKTGGLAGVALAVPSGASLAAAPADSGAKPQQEPLFAFFTDDEARFIDAAVDRLIPADGQWGGAREAGVLYYIDKQLASAYGAGERMYLEGPWDADSPAEQGYQLRYSPAKLYRVAIGEISEAVAQRHSGAKLWDLHPSAIDAVLSDLESEQLKLPSLPAPVFFETLLANTIEGFFADPAYGGNRGMVSWRMVGFPGAYAQYESLVDLHGYEFKRPPIGIGSPEPAMKMDTKEKPR